MEVSVMGNVSQAKIVKTGLAYRDSRVCSPNKINKIDDKVSFNNSTISLLGARNFRKAELRFSVNAAVKSQPVRSDRVWGPPSSATSKSLDAVRLFVGLPLDTVSNAKTVNHEKAVAAGIKALKLLGVEGVELPVWWGVAEKEAMGKYDWSGYLAVAEMVKKVGLKLHVSLCFHASKQPKIPLPDWVSRIGESQSSIFYTDRSGQQFKDCLSLAVDDLPVLDRKTPTQVYQEFCKSFESSFKHFIGTTITVRSFVPSSVWYILSQTCMFYGGTDVVSALHLRTWQSISMGLGPDGELQYPSRHRLSKSSKIPGVGEFQCYDHNMLSLLKQHAEANGNPLWGLGGPHDAPSYDESPNSNSFFKDNGGSWESPYGDFFLSWYSSRLISHGNRLLSLASSTFGKTGLTIYGRVPLIHSWYKTQSHPSELTAGFYNTVNRDGYAAVAEMFAKNSCKMILSGMDLSDEHQPRESLSSPESLLAQIRTACKKYGVRVSGQNSSVTGAPGGFEQMKKNILGENVVDLFTYQRMGAYFFSPEHFPSFTEFVRNLNQHELYSNDLPVEEEVTESVHMNADPTIQE